MTDLRKRHRAILEVLGRRGYASIEEMVASFDVTPQTLRRDLHELAERGLLRRHHGGASVNSSTANSDYAGRHIENAAEKSRIGTAAAELVSPHTSLFLTPGTTVEAAAAAIAERQPAGLRVVTNSTVAATILDRCPDIQIRLTGGIWLANNRALGGMAAAEMVEQFRCDLAITSIGAIDAEGCLLEYRDEEVVVARAMLRNARHRVLLADHTKFSRVATYRLGRLGDITTLVTDKAPAESAATLLHEAGCRIVLAGSV
jgi:DeoR family transcriptional regulator, glycerol-3-phosphate regulon repressor